MKKIFFTTMLLLVMAISCRKDYADGPSPFYVHEAVKLTGINPRNSFRPLPCCTCPCYVDTVYKDEMWPNYWFYNIHDLVKTDSPLTHVPNNDLKKW